VGRIPQGICGTSIQRFAPKLSRSCEASLRFPPTERFGARQHTAYTSRSDLSNRCRRLLRLLAGSNRGGYHEAVSAHHSDNR